MRGTPDFRFDSLPLCLLLSCLLHGLVIIAPHVLRTRIEARPVVVGAHHRRPVLQATLNPETKEITAVPTLSRTTKKTQPIPEAKPEVLELPVNYANVPHETGAKDAFDLFPLPEPIFFDAGELTVKPQILGEPDLESGDIGEIYASGRLVLALRINERGEVVDTSVDFSDLPDVFSHSATQAFRNLRFVAGELNGQKVGSVLRIEVRYDDNQAFTP